MGVRARRHRSANQAGVSQACTKISPGREQGEGRRSPLQGGRRSLRSIEKPGKARGVRPAGHRVLAPARSSGRLPTGERASSSAAPAPAHADATPTTATSSNPCSARAGAGRGPPAGAASTRDAAKIIMRRVLLDLDATLQGGSRTFTLRVPEIDAEGRRDRQGACAQRASAQGHSSRTDHSAGRSGRAARTAEGSRRRSVHRSRIPAAPAVSDRGPRSVSRFAGGAVGSGARRHREDADADRHRRFEDTGGRARRQQAQTEGRAAYPHRRPAIFMWCCRSPCPPPPTRRPGPPTAPWPTRCRSIRAQTSECNVMPLPEERPCAARSSKNAPSSASRI